MFTTLLVYSKFLLHFALKYFRHSNSLRPQALLTYMRVSRHIIRRRAAELLQLLVLGPHGHPLNPFYR